MSACARCGEQAPEGSRFCPACGAPLSALQSAAERRKVVTMVFADVVRSTALAERVDPETLRWAMQRWFGRMRDAVERNGGTVEKFIGDAVVAVFGVPVAHEDDVLRAVRAAAEMREQMAALGGELRRERGVEFTVRIGVNTGEAVTGAAAAGGSFTTGDTVNVAARLEQSARPGDILLGRDTYRLVRHAVDAEPVAPLTVKGKGTALEAFRLLSVVPAARGRPERVRAPLVGRERELRQVLDAFDRALADRSCRLFTVLGVAGVGKSRLVAEVIDALRGGGTVAVGRCLPYGDGLTWWPLAEALGTSGLLERVAVDEPAVSRAVELLKPTVGRVARDEAFWVMRKALQALARRRPTVLVVDDLQWADSTFMDFLDHVVSWEHDAPLLLLVMARPELRDARPRWGEGRPNAGSVLLEPLAEAEAGELLEHLLGPARLSAGTAARILDVAAGNPLFVVEVVAMLSDEGVLPWRDPRGVAEPAAIAVPLTIQALLAARLDRLGEDERTLIEAASIEGKHFTRDAVAALVGDGDGHTIGIQLHALVRKGLIRAEGSGDERFRFDHQLIRDAAYDGMSKERRADLHEWFASWLQAHGSAVLGSGELVGYHLECAVGLRRELGETRAITAQLAARASSNLSAAGHRAAQRDDHAAAIALFERAIALVDSDDAARGALLPALGTSLFEAGRMAEATRVLEEAIAGAPEPWLEARARIEREFVRLELETGVGAENARRLVDEVLPVLERARDDHGQCRAWSLRAHAAWQSGRVERADADWVQAVACARRAGDERELFATLGWRATAAVLGPTPVDEAIGRCEEIREFVRSTPVTLAWALNPLALLHAMRGQFELAARFLHRANEILHELGSLHSSAPHLEALVRLLAGEPKRAEVALRAGVDRLASMNSLGLLATTNAILAKAVYAQGRMQEADELCRRASDAAAADDIFTQVIWRGVKAKILAGQGRCDDALALAGEAVALATPTDLLTLRGDALLDLAVVLQACAPESQSRCATRGALSLYERKGNRVAAARARSLLSTR